jgi:DnaJ domain
VEEPGIQSAIEDRVLTPDEIGLLAGLIIDETDHYTVLGVDRKASKDDIRNAYCIAVEYFHPLKSRGLTESDNLMQWRLSSAWVRLQKAFSVLSNSNRRQIYDTELSSKVSAREVPESERSQSLSAQDLNSFEQSGPAKVTAERRRAERLPLRLPLRVSFEQVWEELTQTLDVSPLAIRFYLSRRIEPGSRLHVELPMPEQLRTYAGDNELCVKDAFVTYIIQDNRGRQVVAEFIN